MKSLYKKQFDFKKHQQEAMLKSLEFDNKSTTSSYKNLE